MVFCIEIRGPAESKMAGSEKFVAFLEKVQWTFSSEERP